MKRIPSQRHYLLRYRRLVAAAILLPALLLADEIRVAFPNQLHRRVTLRTFYIGNVEYLSGQELAEIFSVNTYVNDDVNKLVLYFREGEVKITAFSSFVVVNEEAFQMPLPTYFDGQEYFLPARAFFSVLGATVLRGARYNEARRSFMGPNSYTAFNIFSAKVESKQNGTLIRVKTGEPFDTRNIVRYITDNGWLVVQVPGGIVDTLALNRSSLGGIIRNAWGRQLDKSAELRFKLTDRVNLPEVYQIKGGDELHIAIRNPSRPTNDRSNEMREQWYLDTIVIDPGHGGIDAGTVGKGGLKEKTVTLDVGLRLGRLIKRKTSMRVVYTRDEDIFIPLWQRTKIANEASGKLFISIHVNGVKNRDAHGFETWLLAPANTEEAIEVARLENSVIALEESNHAYQEFSDEALILSTMAQSAWMKESEVLAAIVQEQLGKRLDAPNRGVKQAGFLVLIGATMPNVLVETGFISNRIEEKKLGQNEYRQHIAEGLYNAIMLFKEKYEGAMLAEQDK
ncbi:MAG: N-acetylmuramoyl-L-alanine amidase [Fidelibacterota bacterium]|nr:MAG: N-acetylmuramoyl-L-alanine amidase [Candidatus Neomarinimicrobiota bacterium]